MDLHLYLRVVWRFRVLVLSGLLLACALATLSFVRVSTSGFSYRESEEWASEARLLVTGPELSLSSSIDQAGDAAVDATLLGTQQAALQRYATLAVLYARLADSDTVLQIVRKGGPVNGKIQAVPVTATDKDDTALPLIDVAAFSDSPVRAYTLATREVAALQEFLASEQRADSVPPERRVSFELVKKPTPAVLVTGRSRTLPIVVFLTVLITAIGLAFVLENLRPRIGPVRAGESHSTQAEPERRSA